MDKATFAEAWAAGRTMTLEQMITYALASSEFRFRVEVASNSEP
jgi:hypothetical protein